ncbi:flagellar basal body P-ring protein FlgI [bacterium]|nr:MAG: flagellar basal body P-ring protein FlgI [bacterium]
MSDSTVRVKDVAQVRNARTNQLTGLGIILGLQGTGDSKATIFTNKAFVNMLERLGLPNMGNVTVKNVAAVMVTANLPPFVKPGQTIDVNVASMGDAKSIENGVLVKKNVPTVGRVPNGALVEKEVNVTMLDENGNLFIDLLNPDYTTASELADKINKSLLGNAKAMDPASVRVFVTNTYRENLVDLVARIENINLSPRNNAAKIVLDERTGTILIGQNVKISPVAVSHGGLTVKIEKQNDISQPNALSQGQTTGVTNTKITAIEEKGVTKLFDGGTTIGELVKSLNVLGVSTKDLITIIQTIKAAGALNAQLEII